MKLRIMLAAWCAALLVAACGNGADTEPAPDAADMQPELTPGGGDLPPVIVDTTQADAAVVVDVTLTEYEIGLSMDAVPAGTITFHVRNAGSERHALRIYRGDDEWETDAYDPGEQVSMSIALEPGTYTVECPVVEGANSHVQRGMRRTLRVN